MVFILRSNKPSGIAAINRFADESHGTISHCHIDTAGMVTACRNLRRVSLIPAGSIGARRAVGRQGGHIQRIRIPSIPPNQVPCSDFWHRKHWIMLGFFHKYPSFRVKTSDFRHCNLLTMSFSLFIYHKSKGLLSSHQKKSNNPVRATMFLPSMKKS